MSVTISATTPIRTALLGIAMTFALASPGQASAGRTFVASGGNDSNTATNCPAASPCRSFAAAYGVTTSGGEIIALDPAGYGTLTITGPISIIGVLDASITVPTSGTGVTVSAGASNIVILRNLQINGGNAANATGIALTSGRLILENSTLKLLTTGLSIAANTKSDLKSTDIFGNTTGISTTGAGTNSSQGSPFGPTQVRVFGGSVIDNGTAFAMASPGVDQFSNQFSTIMLFAPGGSPTTDVTGNATLVSCTGQTCSLVITYQSSARNSGNVD